MKKLLFYVIGLVALSGAVLAQVFAAAGSSTYSVFTPFKVLPAHLEHIGERPRKVISSAQIPALLFCPVYSNGTNWIEGG